MTDFIDGFLDDQARINAAVADGDVNATVADIQPATDVVGLVEVVTPIKTGIGRHFWNDDFYAATVLQDSPAGYYRLDTAAVLPWGSIRVAGVPSGGAYFGAPPPWVFAGTPPGPTPDRAMWLDGTTGYVSIPADVAGAGYSGSPPSAVAGAPRSLVGPGQSRSVQLVPATAGTAANYPVTARPAAARSQRWSASRPQVLSRVSSMLHPGDTFTLELWFKTAAAVPRVVTPLARRQQVGAPDQSSTVPALAAGPRLAIQGAPRQVPQGSGQSRVQVAGVTAPLGTVRTLVAAGANDYALTMDASGHLQPFKQGVAALGTTAAAYADGLWHHVVWTKAAATTHLYVDNVDVTPAITNQTIVPALAAAVVVGQLGGGSQFFSGTIDELAIYPTPLTAAQVAAHYNAGTAPVGNNSDFGFFTWG